MIARTLAILLLGASAARGGAAKCVVHWWWMTCARAWVSSATNWRSHRILMHSAHEVRCSHAHCQIAICNPSRASVMTGMRPDTLRVWGLKKHFREEKPKVITLPQWFKQHGYHALDR